MEATERDRLQYEAIIPRFRRFADVLDRAILDSLRRVPGIVAVTLRVKTFESVSDKLARKRSVGKGAMEVANIRDFIGVRIVFDTTIAMPDIEKRLEATFDVMDVFEWTFAELNDDRLRSKILGVHLQQSISAEPQWAEFEDLSLEIILQPKMANALFELEHNARWKNPTEPISLLRLIQETSNGVGRLVTIVDELERIVSAPGVHEKRDIHPFIAANPFLLHSNHDAIISEVPIGMGTEHRMDFLVREPNGEYVLVEIENPNHRLVNQNGDISAHVNHAVQQVENWQEWIEDNLPTAQRYFADISSPRGLVIIGRSRNMARFEKRKIARRNTNLASRMKILTYDDLLAGARAHIESLRKALGGL